MDCLVYQLATAIMVVILAGIGIIFAVIILVEEDTIFDTTPARIAIIIQDASTDIIVIIEAIGHPSGYGILIATVGGNYCPSRNGRLREGLMPFLLQGFEYVT